MTECQQLEQTIAALEAQRPILGDASDGGGYGDIVLSRICWRMPTNIYPQSTRSNYIRMIHL